MAFYATNPVYPARLNEISQMKNRRILALAFVSFVLLACNVPIQIPEPPSGLPRFECDDLVNPFWSALDYGNDSPNIVKDKVISLLAVNPALITQTDRVYGDDEALQWAIPPRDYSAGFRDGKLGRLLTSWRSNTLGLQPTIADIIGCIGQPDQYSMLYMQDNAPRLDVDLWYLDRGLLVSGTTFYGGFAGEPSVTEAYRMWLAIGFEPGTGEQAVCRAIPNGCQSSGFLEFSLRTMKPWPGSVEKLQMDSCFDNPEICVGR